MPPVASRMTLAPTRARDLACIVLAAVSGATDVIGFLALGGAFSSVMTGNMVLVGIAVGRGEQGPLTHVGVAIAAYIVGCALGARLGGRAASGAPKPAWPMQVNRVLWFEAAAFAVAAVIWWADGSHPSGAVATLSLALDAAALGSQSSAIARFGVPGLSTTYMTGTLTTMVIGLATTGHVRGAWPNLRLLVALIVGAALGALVVTKAAPAAPVLSICGIAVVLVLGLGASVSSPVEPSEQPSPAPR
jgi:uncharacterized membrane protein YoaK (UPF0700 family)